MIKTSNVSFVGLGFLFIGFFGFLVIAVLLDDHHPGLFAIILCWYGLTISWAGLALRKDVRGMSNSFNR